MVRRTKFEFQAINEIAVLLQKQFVIFLCMKKQKAVFEKQQPNQREHFILFKK